MAKLKVTETAKQVALEGMQMMGGYGYATEYDMEGHVRTHARRRRSTAARARSSATSSARRTGCERGSGDGAESAPMACVAADLRHLRPGRRQRARRPARSAGPRWSPRWSAAIRAGPSVPQFTQAAGPVGHPARWSAAHRQPAHVLLAFGREREAALVGHVAVSRLPLRRAAFSALKGAATLGYYLAPAPPATPRCGTRSATPARLGLRPDAPPAPLAVHRVTRRRRPIDCDVVVVGSGAGGGTAAAVLAPAGLDVVVLERGEYYDDADFDGGELSGLSRLYAGGPTATAEGQLSLLEGACLGGGTVVNWTTSFETPAAVREEWAALGAPQFAERRVLPRARRRQQPGSASTATTTCPRARDQALERGARRWAGTSTRCPAT